MATAANDNDRIDSIRNNDDTDDADDDFEVVGVVNSRDDDEDDNTVEQNTKLDTVADTIPPANDDGSILTNSTSDAAESYDAQVPGSVYVHADSINVIDPCKTYETIRANFQSTKDTLLEQQTQLCSSIAILREEKEQKDKEIKNLNERLCHANDELELAKQEVKSLLIYRNQVDELTAKLCHQEDLCKIQEDTIKELKGDGCMVSPRVQDMQYAAQEIRAKDEVIKKLHLKLDEMDNMLACERERGDNAEAIIQILNEENDEGRRMLGELRQKHDTEFNRFRRQLDVGLAAVNSPIRDLHRDTYTCDLCHLRFVTNEQFSQHMASCNPQSIAVTEID